MKARIVETVHPPDDLPPTGLAVLALVEIPGATGVTRRRIRATWIAERWLEGPDPDWCDEDEDGEIWLPSGWYEATAVGEAELIPLDEGDRVVAWMELPEFEVSS